MATAISTCNCKPALLVALQQDECTAVVNGELGKGSHATLANTTELHCVTVELHDSRVSLRNLRVSKRGPLFLFPTKWEVKILVPCSV